MSLLNFISTVCVNVLRSVPFSNDMSSKSWEARLGKTITWTPTSTIMIPFSWLKLFEWVKKEKTQQRTDWRYVFFSFFDMEQRAFHLWKRNGFPYLCHSIVFINGWEKTLLKRKMERENKDNGHTLWWTCIFLHLLFFYASKKITRIFSPLFHSRLWQCSFRLALSISSLFVRKSNDESEGDGRLDWIDPFLFCLRCECEKKERKREEKMKTKMKTKKKKKKRRSRRKCVRVWASILTAASQCQLESASARHEKKTSKQQQWNVISFYFVRIVDISRKFRLYSLGFSHSVAIIFNNMKMKKNEDEEVAHYYPTRVDFPLHWCFELHRRRERYPDGWTSIVIKSPLLFFLSLSFSPSLCLPFVSSYRISIVTNVKRTKS